MKLKAPHEVIRWLNFNFFLECKVDLLKQTCVGQVMKLSVKDSFSFLPRSNQL